MKYLGIYLTKYVQALHTKNYKTKLKETKDLNKWRDLSGSWVERFNIFKSSLPKLIYRFTLTSVKTQQLFW